MFFTRSPLLKVYERRRSLLETVTVLLKIRIGEQGACHAKILYH
jgi:hypothetical protein